MKRMKSHTKPNSESRAAAEPTAFDVGVRDMMQTLEETHRMLQENSRMLDAIIKHLGVPYKKRPLFR